MILERIEREMTRQDKTEQDRTGQDKQREIIDEQKSKEIITHTNVHKYRRMMNDSNNNSNNYRNEKTNTRISKS